MKNNSESGVTLIEILIAVSLLSLLSVGMLVAMRLGLTTMDKTDSRLVRNRRVSNSRKIIESEIEGFIPSTAIYHPKPTDAYPIPFLQTESQSMRFVTSYSLEEAWRGRPRIAVMQVIPGENGQGVRLIVNESAYTGPEQAGQQIVGIQPDPASGRQITLYAAVVPGAQSFVLADRLASCRFSYLEPRFEAPFQLWRPDWVQPLKLPLAIRIDMAPLDPAPADLRISTVTVPLNVNRVPGTTYADYQPPQ